MRFGGNVGDKAAINLDAVEGELPQTGEARVTSPKIVESASDAKIFERVELCARDVKIPDDGAFGNFNCQPSRIEMPPIQTPLDLFDQIWVMELEW